jgi:hypothetical protein
MSSFISFSFQLPDYDELASGFKKETRFSNQTIYIYQTISRPIQPNTQIVRALELWEHRVIYNGLNTTHSRLYSTISTVNGVQ